MGLSTSARSNRLVLPHPDKPEHPANLSTIVRWANSQTVNQVVAGTGVTIDTQTLSGPDSTGANGTGIVTINSSGGFTPYASLTGPGETTTPGTLTQLGAFNVEAPAAGSIYLSADGGNQIIFMQAGASLHILSGGVPITINSAGAELTLESGGDEIDIDAGGGKIDIVTTGSDILVQTETATITLNTGNGGTTGGGDIDINSAGADVNIFSYAGAINITGADVSISSNTPGGPVQICDAAANLLGFFSATPVPQQATPVTLADVIALLQAYGLSM